MVNLRAGLDNSAEKVGVAPPPPVSNKHAKYLAITALRRGRTVKVGNSTRSLPPASSPRFVSRSGNTHARIPASISLPVTRKSRE